MYNALYALEGSISAIRAFNDLLAAANNQGDPLTDISGGIHLLLGTQIDALSAAEGALRREILDLKKQVNEFSANSALNLKSNKINASQDAIPGVDYYRENQLLIARLNAAGKTLEEISVLTGLGRDRVRIFIETMPDHIVEEANTSDPMALRREIIAQKIAEGYDAGELAQACNLKRSTVEKVIGQLMGGHHIVEETVTRRAGNE